MGVTKLKSHSSRVSLTRVSIQRDTLSISNYFKMASFRFVLAIVLLLAYTAQCRVLPDQPLADSPSAFAREVNDPCVNQNRRCDYWGPGECKKNPDYMKTTCPVTCGTC